MSHNETVIHDIILGKRIAFIELRGEIGTGNFSQVRLGVHALTKGELIITHPVTDIYKNAEKNGCVGISEKYNNFHSENIIIYKGLSYLLQMPLTFDYIPLL